MSLAPELPHFGGPVMVTLIDGSLVFSDAEAWRHETEARMLLNDYPLEARREMLAGIEKKRGKCASDALRETMTKLHEAKNADPA